MKPFQNESEVINIDELTIENRVDRISMYGALQITKDKAGLDAANELHQLMGQIVEQLQSENLPANIDVTKSEDEVENPFGAITSAATDKGNGKHD